MSNSYRDKLLTVGTISRRDRPQITEGKSHPETRRPWKRTETDASVVVEHSTRDDRVDAVAKVTAPVHGHLGDMRRQPPRVG